MTATTRRPTASPCRLGTVMKLRATTRAPIMIAERTPPMLSTGSVASLTCAGTWRQAM